MMQMILIKIMKSAFLTIGEFLFGISLPDQALVKSEYEPQEINLI